MIIEAIGEITEQFKLSEEDKGLIAPQIPFSNSQPNSKITSIYIVFETLSIGRMVEELSMAPKQPVKYNRKKNYCKEVFDYHIFTINKIREFRQLNIINTEKTKILGVLEQVSETNYLILQHYCCKFYYLL